MARGFATRGAHQGQGRPSKRQKKEPKTDNEHDAAGDTVMQEDRQDEPAKLLFAMDYGTKTLSAAYRIARASDTPTRFDVYDVHFDSVQHVAPQVAAWTKEGEFIWGRHVKTALKKSIIQQDDVIELWKLLLYRDHEDSEFAREIEDQLDYHTLEQLLHAHMKAVVEEARRIVKKGQALQYSEQEIEGMPIELFLSVPQIWTAPANLQMVQAAKAAGISRVELVYEPQCAAAFYTHAVKDRLPRQLALHDVIMIADIGGGTGDFVSYECRNNLEGGAKVGLQLIGEAQGALCGSEFVNRNFITWFKRQTPNFAAKCRELGLSKRTCVRRASGEFETIKLEFTIMTKELARVTIYGGQGARIQQWTVPVSSSDIVRFMTPVLEEIARHIDTQLRPNTKLILVPGGFGHSEYLLEYLQQRYGSEDLKIVGQANPAMGAYQPVSHGALLRYKDILTDGVPSKEFSGIAQVEVYDKDIHHDATHFTGDKLPNGKICRNGPIPNRNVVEVDPFDGEDVVYERWCPILARGQITSPGQALRTETWQQKMVKVNDDNLTVQVYWSERDIMEHQAIRQGKDGYSPLIRGVEPWGDELEITLPDLAKLGFEAIATDNKGMVYEIYFRLVMQCEGANMSIRCQLALLGTQPYDENGESRASQVELAPEQVFELCENSHNPFPRVAPN